jgi:hypothetical protein
MREKARRKEEENLIKQMRKRWPNYEFSVHEVPTPCFRDGLPMAVNSSGRIHWDYLRSKRHLDRHIVYDVVSVDNGPNDDVYTLQRLADVHGDGVNAEIYYLTLVVYDKEDTSFHEITKGLPPTESDTCWVMRVLESKIVLCNGYGKVFILACDMQGLQLNKECSFSLPTLGSAHEKPEVVTTRHYMCATNKREVIIARPKGNEVFICPITDEGQMERIIQIPLEQHETESLVCGVAFHATHEEEIVVLRETPDQDSLWSNVHIEVYSRNGDSRDFYHLPASYVLHSCLLNNAKAGIIAAVHYKPCVRSCNYHYFQIQFQHLVGKVFLRSEVWY